MYVIIIVRDIVHVEILCLRVRLVLSSNLLLRILAASRFMSISILSCSITVFEAILGSAVIILSNCIVGLYSRYECAVSDSIIKAL